MMLFQQLLTVGTQLEVFNAINKAAATSP